MTVLNPKIEALAKAMIEARNAYEEAKNALLEATAELCEAVAPSGDGQ